MPPIKPKLTPSQRQLRGQIAANARWAATDYQQRLAVTKPGRDAAEKRFADQVDPERKLPKAERDMLIRNAKAAYFAELAYKRSRKQQLKRAGAAL